MEKFGGKGFIGAKYQEGKLIDVIYYYVMWTDNGRMLSEANTRRQERKYLL